MSRQAAAQAAKKDQKAALAIKQAQKEYEQSIGYTKDIKQAIGADRLICKSCGATEMGPLTICECKGGKVRPAADDDCLVELIAAARLRLADSKAARIAESNLNKGAAQKERAARRAGAGVVDLEAEFQGDGVEMTQNVVFPVGKLGMDLEKNAVAKVVDGGPAAELKVLKGWIIYKVNGEEMAADKKAIGKAIMKGMKEGPVTFSFRVPITEGFSHCASCNKFIADGEYNDGQLSSKGPGVQMCAACEECADMGDFE